MPAGLGVGMSFGRQNRKLFVNVSIETEDIGQEDTAD
jgi:hypothetical protein